MYATGRFPGACLRRHRRAGPSAQVHGPPDVSAGVLPGEGPGCPDHPTLSPQSVPAPRSASPSTPAELTRTGSGVSLSGAAEMRAMLPRWRSSPAHRLTPLMVGLQDHPMAASPCPGPLRNDAMTPPRVGATQFKAITSNRDPDACPVRLRTAACQERRRCGAAASAGCEGVRLPGVTAPGGGRATARTPAWPAPTGRSPNTRSARRIRKPPKQHRPPSLTVLQDHLTARSARTLAGPRGCP